MPSAAETLTYTFEPVEVQKPTIPALINFDDALDLLNISKATLYKLVSQKLIGHIRIYKKILFKQEHIKEYLSANEIQAVPMKEVSIKKKH